MQALNEFADYVERQQFNRSNVGRAQSVATNDSGYATERTGAETEKHAELDVLDSLDLSERSADIRLKDLLLDLKDDSQVTLQQLGDVLQDRLLEGHGEALFDLGQENNGESLAFSKEQWDVALGRIRRAAALLKAECRVLITRNVGGPEEAELSNQKDKSATGKLLIRLNPETIDDVIETRIAVVGNGIFPFF